MIRKIEKQEADNLQGVGYFSIYGACIGDAKEVIIEGTNGLFLASIDEFEFIGSCGVKASENLITTIGGLVV